MMRPSVSLKTFENKNAGLGDGEARVEEEEGRPTPGSLMPQSPHLGGLPRFLMCWYWSFPPGVLMTRTLLERVLYLDA